MLDVIPPEVLSHIALHLTLPTCAAPANLLQTSKSIHNAISTKNNPRLYARVYRASFDTAAAERRLGEISAVGLTEELGRRVRALTRLTKQVAIGDVTGVRDEDLWVIFIMLLENDGKNLEHLLDEGSSFNLPQFLRLYHEQHLITAAIAPGYPEETVGRALAMWIAWFLTGINQNLLETPKQLDERLFVLRPYVFAAQRYETYYAPWTIQALPLLAPQSERDNHLNPGPFDADLVARSRVVEIGLYDRKVELSPPILAHAAILRFFSKKSRGDKVDNSLGPFAGLRGGNNMLSGFGLDGDLDDEDVDEDEEDCDEVEIGNVAVKDSHQHDRDYQRLTNCYDPSICRGMKRAAWRGSWEGAWEGNYSFFDFDSFREMLAGQSQALYEGPYGEQAQVWRLKETFVRPRKDHKGKGNRRSRGLPIKGPMTNAGFPTDQPPSTSAGLATAEAEALTLQETIRQQVEAIDGYEIVPDHEIEGAFADDDGEESGLEIILTGTGHSAWGRFILKGRVRAWDGMASLVKEYAPDSRGKWVYRGYILAGDVFVGRWRDTFTPEAFVGYEGTFILNRR